MKSLELLSAALLTISLGISGCSQGNVRRNVAHFVTVPTDSKLKTCSYKNSDVDHHYELTITPTSNSSFIAVDAWQYDLDASGKQINRQPYKVVPNQGHVTTPLNLNLGLDKTKKKKVMVHLILDKTSTTWHFLDGNMGVTSTEGYDQKDMFCMLSSGQNSVDFGVEHKNKPKPGEKDGHTYGFFNVNIIIQMSADTSLPITIDPEVKNDG